MNTCGFSLRWRRSLVKADFRNQLLAASTPQEVREVLAGISA